MMIKWRCRPGLGVGAVALAWTAYNVLGTLVGSTAASLAFMPERLNLGTVAEGAEVHAEVALHNPSLEDVSIVVSVHRVRRSNRGLRGCPIRRRHGTCLSRNSER
jgi:hypothetical protein